MERHHVSDKVVAGQIAVLVLRASVQPGQVQLDDVVLEPEYERLSDASAADKLAAMPKPLVCSAFLQGPELHVRCVHRSRPAIVTLQTEHGPEQRSGAEMEEAHIADEVKLLRQYLTPYMDWDTPCVVFQSTATAMRVSLSQFARWRREYEILGNYNRALRSPGDAPRPSDTVTLDISPSRDSSFRLGHSTP